ncbi:amine oxidase [Nemania serpens]|nr:amine oxidase [Nemania serpens]
MSSNQQSVIDVIVVGAGLSGLQAASSLTEAGLSTVVLEARSRVGGKTWSVSNENAAGIADLGAEWLNDTTQPLVYQLAKRLGCDFNEVKVQGESILQGLDRELIRHEYGEQAPLPGGEEMVVGRIKQLFEDESRKIDLETFSSWPHDDVTLEEFVRSRGGGQATLATVAVWARVMLGCEPADLSAAYFLAYCKSQGGLMKMRSGNVQGKYVTIRTGAQSISDRLTALLPPGTVKLDTAVKSIVQSDRGVEVHSIAGKVFRARKVILAFSTPLYKKINFSPPLPAEKALLTGSTKLGYYAKVLATYNKPWWRETGLSGASQSFIGPGAATRDTSEDSQSTYRLTSFIAGGQGEAWSKLTPLERRAAALGQFAEMFGSKEALNPTQYMEQQWSLEEWSSGCPCPYTAPGVLTKVGGYLRLPFNHIHFVGTETAVEWIGYMEGALASGNRGAREVKKLLGK